MFSDCVNEERYETTTLIDMPALQRRARTDESPSGQQINIAGGLVSQTLTLHSEVTALFPLSLSLSLSRFQGFIELLAPGG